MGRRNLTSLTSTSSHCSKSRCDLTIYYVCVPFRSGFSFGGLGRVRGQTPGPTALGLLFNLTDPSDLLVTLVESQPKMVVTQLD